MEKKFKDKLDLRYIYSNLLLGFFRLLLLRLLLLRLLLFSFLSHEKRLLCLQAAHSIKRMLCKDKVFAYHSLNMVNGLNIGVTNVQKNLKKPPLPEKNSEK
ncbi:MAG: hypothetical protein QXL78_03330 [Methanocellales archaeon]